MAQTEDTELRDIVIEALEKNGSLAKIRALLRANIFLAFEDECENLRHNLSLDGVLKSPEGVAALCVVHDFLEFCNLKNTLFVYKSETRQARDYQYDGRALRSQLRLERAEREPALVALIRTAAGQSRGCGLARGQDSGDGAKEEHDGSYIVHSECASPASTGSPASARSEGTAERTRLQLRLPLDHSDTDSSSEGSRGRSAEYVPSQHAVNEYSTSQNTNRQHTGSPHAPDPPPPPGLSLPNYFTKIGTNTSSDSTSYIDLKPFSSMDEKMLNTPGLPAADTPPEQDTPSWKHTDHSSPESSKSATLSSVPSLSTKNEKHDSTRKQTSQEMQKSNGEMAEYSYDFSASQESKNNVNSDRKLLLNSPKHYGMDAKSPPGGSPVHNSHSSVSLSDVADLVSDRSSVSDKQSSGERSPLQSHAESPVLRSSHSVYKLSEQSGASSQSPVPSLSNLSLDLHSD